MHDAINALIAGHADCWMLVLVSCSSCTMLPAGTRQSAALAACLSSLVCQSTALVMTAPPSWQLL
jgi:hypothetical protein